MQKVPHAPAHALGAATLVFTVLQVILAASRPLPGAPRRYQWLMLHRALALVCFALAFAAVPLGVTVRGARIALYMCCLHTRHVLSLCSDSVAGLRALQQSSHFTPSLRLCSSSLV